MIPNLYVRDSNELPVDRGNLPGFCSARNLLSKGTGTLGLKETEAPIRIFTLGCLPTQFALCCVVN